MSFLQDIWAQILRKAETLDYSLPVTIEGGGGIVITTDPVTGAKTVTSTAAEIFAGASALSGRKEMAIYNEGSQPVYWGDANVTTSNGFPIPPGDTVVLQFDPNEAVAIYCVASANTSVRVVELA